MRAERHCQRVGAAPGTTAHARVQWPSLPTRPPPPTPPPPTPAPRPLRGRLSRRTSPAPSAPVVRVQPVHMLHHHASRLPRIGRGIQEWAREHCRQAWERTALRNALSCARRFVVPPLWPPVWPARCQLSRQPPRPAPLRPEQETMHPCGASLTVLASSPLVHGDDAPGPLDSSGP